MQKNNIKKHSALKLALIAITMVSTIIAGSMLAWIFTREGSYGLYRWEQSSRIYFNLSIILLVIPVCLFIVFLIINFSGKQRSSVAVLIIFCAIISVAYTTTAFSYIVANSNPVLIETKPVLLLTGITGSNGIPDIALIFRTEKSSANILYYGKEELNHKIVESNPGNQHVLVMKDLEPDSKYNWQLNNEDVYSFNTPMGYSDNPEDIIYHFAVGGDAHIGSSLNTFSSSNPYAAAGNFAATESIISYAANTNQAFDTFFILGDLTHTGIYNDNWRKAIDLLSTYSFSMPFRPVIGNHDAIFNGTNHFISYFWPDEIRSSRDDMNLYYRIDVGTIHFLMLNVLWSGKESISNSQIKWLVEQLTSIPGNDWTIIMQHGMVYSSGEVVRGVPFFDPEEIVGILSPIIEYYGVDLLISGHNHLTDFLQKNGVTYCVIGTLGGTLTKITNVSPASIWHNDFTFGFLDATVYPEKIHLCFRDSKGIELESFEIGKNK